MTRLAMIPLIATLVALNSVQAYFLVGHSNVLLRERSDPIVNPGKVSGHQHTILGGSNFRMTTNTAALRQSECTTTPIVEDKSAYWFPSLFFQWANGSFTSVDGGAVMYYLYDNKPGVTTAFPDDFRMITGDPTLRTYDPNSFAQRAVTFLCLDFNGQTTKHNELPKKRCPSGIRAQLNFPNCWNGKDLDSADHKSHVAFSTSGPDNNDCKDPKFPVTLPRIFLEFYLDTVHFDQYRSQAMTPDQPFVYAYGDRTGYGYHGDFLNGWDKAVLQRTLDECHCNDFGDPQCCADKGIFKLTKDQHCRITRSVDEPSFGTFAKLPGNNPVQAEGKRATMFSDSSIPALLAPVFTYRGDKPDREGTIVKAGEPGTAPPPVSQPPTPSASSSAVASQPSSSAPAAVPSSSSAVTPPPSSSAPAQPSPPKPQPSALIPSAPGAPAPAPSSGAPPAGNPPPTSGGNPQAPPPSNGGSQGSGSGNNNGSGSGNNGGSGSPPPAVRPGTNLGNSSHGSDGLVKAPTCGQRTHRKKAIRRHQSRAMLSRAHFGSA